MKSDNKIIITGAAGFIGSGIVTFLNDQGQDNLLLVDDLSNGKWKNLVGKNFLDIIYKNELFDYLKKNQEPIKAIIHMGACSDTTCTDENYLIDNNYRYTQKLASYAYENDIRFIYASSAATYGDGKQGFQDDLNAIENLKPINMYAYSKQLFDLWAKREGLFDKIAGLKYFNVFGPNENHKSHMSSMIYKMFDVVNQNSVINLFKSNDPQNFLDGEQKRDFIYIKDAVKMTCMLIEDEYMHISGLFNIGSGTANSWNSLAQALFKAVNKPIKINYIDMPKNLYKQYQNYTCADMTKFNKLLNCNFKFTSIKDAVKDYVTYLTDDKRW